jgi:tRNA dimethylallyltransferase
MKPEKAKILVVVGPTSSGKSELAVKLARAFNGEIISCDSRQIYTGMDLGTGKIPGRWAKRRFIFKGIAHHLIDFVNPKQQYSAALFQREAKKAIADILKRGKLPILCGGTAHWVDAVVYNQNIPGAKPNFKLRAKLEKLSASDLFARIGKLDPQRAKIIDRFNKRRLIRALEIVLSTGKPIPQLATRRSPLAALWLGIKAPQSKLYKKIDDRLKQRIKAGMIKEVSDLHKKGLSWKRLEAFGLEYKYVSLFLQKKITKQEMLEGLLSAIKHYSTRQMTWWKKNKEIKWFSDFKKAQELVEEFLK